jgi:hypothetical protein
MVDSSVSAWRDRGGVEGDVNTYKRQVLGLIVMRDHDKTVLVLFDTMSC